MVYIFRGQVRAMKDNEMLFQIICICIVVCGCGFIVIQEKASKFTEMTFSREQKVKRRF